MLLPTYNSLQEKSNIFGDRYKCIDKWSDLEEFLSCGSEGLLFRGMCEAKYKNYTSVQRYFKTHELEKTGLSISQILQKEAEGLLASNNKLIKRYYKSVGVDTNWFLQNSFLQHYGGISPFMDFSKNSLVALYFTQEGTTDISKGKDDVDNYCSLYYIKMDDIETITSILKDIVNRFTVGYENIDQRLMEYKGKYPVLYEMTKKSLAPYREDAKKLIDTFLTDSFYNWYEDLQAFCEDEDIFLLIDDNSIRLDSDSLNYYRHVITAANLNLIAQEGVFVMRAGLKPLENKYVHCIDIHKSLIPSIRAYLNDKGITRDLLFPQEEKIATQALEKGITFYTKSNKQ